jgi:hypothetical protein
MDRYAMSRAGIAPKAELVLQGNGNRYSAVATDSGSFRFAVPPAKGSYKLTVSFGGRSFRMAGCGHASD